MPVEIRELVIKATILAEEEGGPAGSQQQAADKTQIVQECVREVLKIIAKKQTR